VNVSPGPAPSRLDIGIVGTGRVGAVLGAALADAGHRVVAASAVSALSRRRAAALLPATPIVAPQQVLARADLVLVAVPDDVLPGMVSGLAGTGSFRRGQLVAHPSGRHGLSVLAPARAGGVLPMALHPAMTFTGTVADLPRLAGCAFGVTAPAELTPVAEALVIEMRGEPVLVPDSARPLYHAALSVAANHLVTLLADALDALRRAGVPDPALVLRPLVNAAVDNTLRDGDGALTGPVSRGDAGTVSAHLSALAADLPDGVDAYLAMARRTADRAIAAGRLDPADAAGLLGVLGGRPDQARA
jgi:predicted short-subunit dehydrogenase-like oxidoreductase (DUF2520 family)